MSKKNPLKLSQAQIDELNFTDVFDELNHDLRSDFVYAPHLWFIFRFSGELIAEKLSEQLLSGQYSPGNPITIEVPKSSRVRVRNSRQMGPNFSRPGSILLPRDRLFYHALAHQALPLVSQNTNENRSFSHRISDFGGAVFVPSRVCWKELQQNLREYSNKEENKYVLKLDISNCFSAINQHTLVNTLSGVGYNENYGAALEKILMRFTGDRSSRGIIQGVMPSDLFGNFYMTPIDTFFDDLNIDSGRYVDDIYIFTNTANEADRLMKRFVPFLRTYDLSLNEAKSGLMPSAHLGVEEPDLEALFQEAVNELSEYFGDEEVSVGYGFQVDWEEENEEVEKNIDQLDPELTATIHLFDSMEEFPGHEENIERFCIPMFERFEADYAVESVLANFHKRPSMSQIYCSYLSKFLEREDVMDFLISRIGDENIFEWQKMWITAALMQSDEMGDAVVSKMIHIFGDHNKHEALRAAAAIFIGKFGNVIRRRYLIGQYPHAGSDYVKSAIFYSARYASAQERRNARANWAGHSELHEFLELAMQRT